jgi:SAM-dependent methyltransferase
MTSTSTSHEYVMGHSAEEQARLDRQGAELRDSTFRFLRDSGIGPGMRVLDVGCGTADVSLVASGLVGPTGEVIGVDQSGDVLATARSRVQAHGATNVRFVESNVMHIGLQAIGGRLVDAVIGRLVIIHLPDPVGMLRALRPLLADNAIVAFQDLIVIDPVPALDRPLLRQCTMFIQRALVAAGATHDEGLLLPGFYREAGLPTPSLRVDGIAIDGADVPRLTWMAETVRTLLPVVEKMGLATAAEVDIDTLAARLVAEAGRVPGTILSVCMAGAAARVPRS